MTDTISKIRREAVERIARKTLRLRTLEERKSDSLDFHELGVLSIRDALEQAFDAGRLAPPTPADLGAIAARSDVPAVVLETVFRIYHLIDKENQAPMGLEERREHFRNAASREQDFTPVGDLIHRGKTATVAELVEWSEIAELSPGDVLRLCTTQGHELYAVWTDESCLELFNPYGDGRAELVFFAAELAQAQGVSL